MKPEDLKNLSKEQVLTLREESAKTALGMMVRKNFSNTDMTEVQQDYLESVAKVLAENNPVKQVGVFALVAVGLDDHGEVQGFISTGGSVGGLQMLTRYFDAAVQKTLHEEGVCGCDNCYMKSLIGLAVGEMVPEKGGLEH